MSKESRETLRKQTDLIMNYIEKNPLCTVKDAVRELGLVMDQEDDEE